MKSLAYGDGYSFYDAEGLLPDVLRDRHYFENAAASSQTD